MRQQAFGCPGKSWRAARMTLKNRGPQRTFQREQCFGKRGLRDAKGPRCLANRAHFGQCDQCREMAKFQLWLHTPIDKGDHPIAILVRWP